MKNKNRRDPVPLRLPSVAAALVVIVLLLANAFAFAPHKIALQVQEQLPILPGTWFGVVLILAVLLMLVAALVHMLGGILDSPAARAWARSQLYEAVLTVLLLVVFLAFIWIFFLNPARSLQSINLVAPSGTIFSCTQASDIFQLGTCSMAAFNNFAYGVFQAAYYATVYLSMTIGVNTAFGLSPENLEIEWSAGVTSVVPISVDVAMGIVFGALMSLFLINQIQLLLLSGSLLWLSFFITLGLIARAFGVSRTFGGAMIAFGLGLGLVYPIVTTLTYGFLDYQLGTGQALTGAQLLSNMFSSALALALGIGLPSGQWVFQVAAAIAGMTFIPFLNFTVVDTFIRDFSRAVGEELDFLSLLTGII